MIATRVSNALAQPTEFNRICVQKTPAPVILCKWASWICDGDRNTNNMCMYTQHSHRRIRAFQAKIMIRSDKAKRRQRKRERDRRARTPRTHREMDGFVAIFAIDIYMHIYASAVRIYLLIAHNHFAIALPAIYAHTHIHMCISNNAIMVSGFVSSCIYYYYFIYMLWLWRKLRFRPFSK